VDDKTTNQALIKGLTPGPTPSHLTRKKPKTIDELFMNLKNTSCLTTITAEESLNEMKQDKATEK
jgi:ABC-type amino acid transport system permease subunit